MIKDSLNTKLLKDVEEYSFHSFSQQLDESLVNKANDFTFDRLDPLTEKKLEKQKDVNK